MDVEIINVKLKILGNDEMNEMEIPVNTEIETLKVLASDFTEIPTDQMTLLFKGKILEDDKRISDYGITVDSVVHLVPRKEDLENHRYKDKMLLLSKYNSKLLKMKNAVSMLKEDLNGSDPNKINNAIKELSSLWIKEKKKLTSIRNKIKEADNSNELKDITHSNACIPSNVSSLFSEEELQMIENDSKKIQGYKKPDFDINYGFQSSEENYPFI